MVLLPHTKRSLFGPFVSSGSHRCSQQLHFSGYLCDPGTLPPCSRSRIAFPRARFLWSTKIKGWKDGIFSLSGMDNQEMHLHAVPSRKPRARIQGRPPLSQRVQVWHWENPRGILSQASRKQDTSSLIHSLATPLPMAFALSGNANLSTARVSFPRSLV